MKAFLAAGATLAIIISGPALSADIITTGSFGIGSFSGWMLDNVGGSTAATWAMMLLGFGIVGRSVRRRKVDVAFA
jgi:hypothetical protein